MTADHLVPEQRRAVLLVTAVAFLMRLGFTLGSRQPVIFGDEAAPLLLARKLLGVGAAPTFGNDAFYHPGYALLQVPFAWLPPGAAHRMATVVNCALLAAVVPLADAAARRLLGASPRQALAVAAVTSLYPAFLLQAGLTWAESLVVPVVLLVFLAFDRMIRRADIAAGIGFGLAAVSAYLTHPRLLAVVLLAPAAAFAAHRWRGLERNAAAGAAATVVVGFLLVRLANAWVRDALYLPGGAGSDEGEVLLRLLRDPLNVLRGIRSLAGQVWYLAVATLGLAPLGALHLWLRARRSTTAAFVLASCAAMLAVSALFVIDPTRPDQRIYGRYGEGFVAVLLVAGIVALVGRASRRPTRDELLVVGALPVVLGVVLLVTSGGGAFDGAVNPFNVLSIEHLLLRWRVNLPAMSAVAALGGLALLGGRAVLPDRRAFLLLALVSTYFAWATLQTGDGFVDPVRRVRSATFTVPRTLPVVEEAAGERFRTVSIDYVAGVRQPQFFGMQLRYRNTTFVPWRRNRDQPPTRPWIVTTKSWPEGVAAGARLVVPEAAKVDEAIWLLPGAELERVRRAGLVVEPDSPPPGPTELLGTVRPEDVQLRLPAGARLVTRLRIENQSRRPWPSTGDAPAPGVPVVVVATWFPDGGGEEDVAVSVADLPHRLFPNAQADLELALVATRPDGSPLPRGRYVVRLSVFAEGGPKVALEGEDLLVTVR